MSIEFWSITIKAGAKEPVVVRAPEDYIINITQAAVVGEGKAPVVIKLETLSVEGEELQAVIGTLRPGTVDQFTMNLVLGNEVEYKFSATGDNKNTVHLSGYFQPGPEDNDDEDMDDEEIEDFDEDDEDESSEEGSGDDSEEDEMTDKAFIAKMAKQAAQAQAQAEEEDSEEEDSEDGSEDDSEEDSEEEEESSEDEPPAKVLKTGNTPANKGQPTQSKPQTPASTNKPNNNNNNNNKTPQSNFKGGNPQSGNKPAWNNNNNKTPQSNFKGGNPQSGNKSGGKNFNSGDKRSR